MIVVFSLLILLMLTLFYVLFYFLNLNFEFLYLLLLNLYDLLFYLLLHILVILVLIIFQIYSLELLIYSYSHFYNDLHLLMAFLLTYIINSFCFILFMDLFLPLIFKLVYLFKN